MACAAVRGGTFGKVRVVRALLAVLMIPVVMLVVPAIPAGAIDTYVVTTTGDGGDTDIGDGDCIATTGGCTLRAAIEEANDDNDLDIIEFALGGPGTIVTSSNLPQILRPLTIDGSTNPGASCDFLGGGGLEPVPTVAISGSALLIREDADGTTIRNLSIHSTSTAISMGGSANTGGVINFFNDLEGVLIECSWLGFDLNGVPGVGQTGNGVSISGPYYVFASTSGVEIGGDSTGAGNYIGAFDGHGISNLGASPDEIVVKNNRIGVRPDGSAAGNGGNGLLFPGRTLFNRIAHSGGNGIHLFSSTELILNNTIRDSGGYGVSVNTSQDFGRINLVENRIFSNGNKGIAISSNQASPEVLITSVEGTDLRLRVRFPGGPGSTFDVEVYFNPECTSPQGQNYQETFTVQMVGDETFFDLTMPTAPSQQFVSAKAQTPGDYVSSEFSNCKGENDRFVVDDVTNGGDTIPGDGVCLGPFGGCTLRAAIEEANALGIAAPEEIVFDLPADGFIAVSGSPLPAVEVPISIDASFNPGATCGSSGSAPFGLVRLNGGPGVDVGLQLSASASGSTVRGLEFTNFGTDGVLVLGDDNVFECNAFGSAADGNVGDGIDVRGDRNIVGGGTAAQGNLVANNFLSGVRLFGGAAFTEVRSNWIGTDGSAALPNTNGVSVGGGASDSRIGSVGQADGSVTGGNVIAGNTNHGVEIGPAGAGNQIMGNLIGLVEDGSAMGNGRDGIRVNADGVLIGRGRGAFNLLYDDPNVVGHNGDSGMALFGDDVVVIENFVGVDSDGNDVGNDDHGIFLGGDDAFVQGNTIGFNGLDGVLLNGLSANVEGNLIGVRPGGLLPAGNGESGVDVRGNANVVGGDDPADGNVIAFSAGAGVSISGGATDNAVRNNEIRDSGGAGVEVLDSATRNRFVENSIVDNEGLGIDLGGDDVVNVNDKEDPDTGANDFVNRAEILDVDLGNTLVLFRYEGTPELEHEIEFSANLECGNSGTGEGLRPIDGLLSFTTDADGNFEGVFDAQGGFVAGEVLTALATSTSFGGVPTTTSEYSACFQVPGTNTTDSDGDGIFDVFELNTDTDGDGLLNRFDADDDGDGRPTEVENVDIFSSGSGNTANALNSDGLGPVDYLDPAELFRLLEPACRVLQTGTVNGGDSIDFSVDGGVALAATNDPDACDVPDTATAVMANVIIVDPVAGGNLRLTAAGTTPLGGIVNFSSNELNNTNAQSVPLSASGELNVSVFMGGSTAVAAGGIEIEILGYYEAAETPSLVFNTVTPCAVFDTRPGQGGSGPLTADAVVGIDVVGGFPASQGGGNTNCQVPDGAEGVLANVVAVETLGIVDVESAITGATVVSNQTHSPAMNNSSAVTLPIDAQGHIFLGADVSGSSNLRVVVLGYYFPTMVGAAASAGMEFQAVVPCAAFDTRSGQGGFAGQRTNGQATDYDVVGSFDPGQGGGNSDCGIPASALAVELNLVAVQAERGANLQVAATGTTPTGGVLNFANLTPNMNNSNALVVEVSGGGEITVIVNAGNTAAGLPVTHVRGVISGYYTFQSDQS